MKLSIYQDNLLLGEFNRHYNIDTISYLFIASPVRPYNEGWCWKYSITNEAFVNGIKKLIVDL